MNVIAKPEYSYSRERDIIVHIHWIYLFRSGSQGENISYLFSLERERYSIQRLMVQKISGEAMIE